jgi:predicted permease
VRPFLAETLRDIRFALRTFKRAPLVALTIASTIALGLGLVAVAFTILNLLLFRVDHVPNVHEMFSVQRSASDSDDSQQFTRDEFDALRRETTLFSDAYAQVEDVYSFVEGRPMFGSFITGNAFQVLGVRAAMGRVLTTADDERGAGRPVIVLSHRGWDRLFARDPSIVGRRLLINKTAFEIVGVMPEEFRGLAAVAPDDYWAPLSMLEHVHPIHRRGAGNAVAAGVAIIGRLKRGLSLQAAESQLAVWDAARSDTTSRGRNGPRMTLVPRRGIVEQSREAWLVTAPLFFSCGLILLIACANVGNLLLARAVARQREIGIRLSLGATRRRLVRQLLTESLLLALVAAVAGLAISRVALKAIGNALMNSNLGDIRVLIPSTDWRVVLFLAAGAVVSTIAFALAPALQATRVDPIRTMRGEAVPLVGDARPQRPRNILIALQVCASALLLISAAVFLRSALAATAFDPGMRTSDTVVVQITSEPARKAMVQAVTGEPSVTAIAASWPAPAAAARAAYAETRGTREKVSYRFVSPEYFTLLDIGIVRGRTFTPAERAAAVPIAVVSATTARALWPNADPIGQTVRLDPDPPAIVDASERAPTLQARAVTVVGVVRDVSGFRMAPFNKAVVYLPTGTDASSTSLIARVSGDPEQVRQTLLNRLATIDTTIDPNMRSGEGQIVGTMQWVTRMEATLLKLAFSFTVGLGTLALALTLSGLFSVLSYLVEQRSREIGVHMAIGATRSAVTWLIVSQAIRPMGLGLLVGAGLAAGLAKLLLTTPAAATIGNIVHVLDPIAYGAGLLIIIAACLAAASIPAMRAARFDPSQMLRQQ